MTFLIGSVRLLVPSRRKRIDEVYGSRRDCPRYFPPDPCPLSYLASQIAFSTLIISTLCRRSRRAARINLLFLKENYIFLYSMIYDMCADRV